MTAIPRSAFTSDLSDRLTTPLRQVAQRRWKVDTAIAILKTLSYCLAILLVAALVLGCFQNLWMPVRVAVAVVAWALLVRFAVRFLRPVFRRWSLGRAAMHVEQDRPELHERLSGAIELAGDHDSKCGGSPSLIAHLFNQAEADAAGVQPGQFVPADRVLRWSFALAPILIAWLTLTLVPATTHTTLAGLYRVLMPWRTTLPDMLTQIVVKPGDVTLVQGDAMDVTAHLSFSGSTGESNVLRKYDGGQTITDKLEQLDPRNYRLHLDNLQQSFSYRVSTSEGDSPWFTAAVHPRPQLTGVEIRCDYPAYTGLAATLSNDRDGAIQALVGTRVTMTVHTALPVVLDKSKLVMDGGTATESALPFVQLDPIKCDYQAQFTIVRSGDYRIDPANDFALTNKDEQAHSIVAIPDEVPTITIVSPEPRVSVGVEDSVPVKFIAKDDFGVTKIEAILQVGDGPIQTVPVNFTTDDKHRVTKPPFVISMAEILKGLDVHRLDIITYQLKVTDNRDPDPQIGFSARQVLKLDLGDSQKYQGRSDQKTADDLKGAIQTAINQLRGERDNVQGARDTDPKRALDEWQRKRLDQANKELPQTSRHLTTAADAAENTVFQEIAEQVKAIAEKQIQPAADDTAQADLNTDKGNQRQDAATRAMAKMEEARKDLQKILDTQAIEKQLAKAEAALDLADAAEKQQEAADLMKTPQQLQQAQQQHQNHQAQQQQRQAMDKQDQAIQKLQDAIRQDEALRDPQAAETAQKLQQLIHKVDDLEKHQDQAAAQTDKQKTAEDVQQAANALAQQQEALNKDIQQSAEQNKRALQQANVNPPTQDQQKDIVKALDRNQLQDAQQQMKRSADQLKAAAHDLQNMARSSDLHPTPQQQDAVNKDQHAADQAQQDQNAAQQAANELKQQPAPANQNDDAAAADAKHAAASDAKHAAEQIKKEAGELHPQGEQAKKDAQAAEQHADAAEHAADQADQAADPQQAQKDRAAAAAELNQAGKELAQAAKENAADHKAAMVAAQHKDAQAAADQAAAQAQKQADLAQAVAAEQHALAQVQNPPPPDQAADQQNQVAEQTKEAKKDAEQLEQQAQHANNPNVQARAKNAEAELAAAQDHAAHAAHAEQEAAQDQHDAANANNAQQAATAEQHADQALAQAADQQHQAEAALAKAEGDLRDATAEQQANAQGQPAQQAAQAAQEAAQAQQDAHQQNPQAAQQAANALAQAAHDMAKGMPGHEPGQPDNAQDPDAKPSDHTAQTPGKTTDSKEGISFAGLPITLPASVLDMGITADQWAVLPPLVKKDLLNAAQQNGPPAYKQMMRDYFAKVAKMQTAGTP